MSNSVSTTEDHLNGASTLTGFRIGGAIDSALRLRPPSSVDDYATKALTKTVNWIFNDPMVPDKATIQNNLNRSKLKMKDGSD